MKECECKDWKENIEKINTPFKLNLTAIGKYDDKVFIFCPWCGKKLEGEDYMGKWEWISYHVQIPIRDKDAILVLRGMLIEMLKTRIFLMTKVFNGGERIRCCLQKGGENENNRLDGNPE